jgi:hypothetical protein
MSSPSAAVTKSKLVSLGLLKFSQSDHQAIRAIRRAAWRENRERLPKHGSHCRQVLILSSTLPIILE